MRNLNFYYGKFQALKNINLDIAEKQGHRLHRSVGLRQVHAAAHLQPHVRAVSRAARRGRDPARRREHPDPKEGCDLILRAQGRHGVPEADARSRCRSTTTSPSACACSRTSRADMDERVEWALKQGRALERGERTSSASERLGPVRRSAAAPVHRARHRDQARGVAAGRAVLGARPDSDRKIEELIVELKSDYTVAIVTHNMQQAARCGLHRLHVPGRPDRVRPTERHLPSPGPRPRTTSPAASADRTMTDKHLSSQFDELSGIPSTRVMEMGGLVEAQLPTGSRR